MTSCIPGRRILTTTSSPLFSVAACTCAIEAAASGVRLEARENVRERPAEGLLDGRHGDRAVERRHAVLELREFVGDVDRAAGRGASTAPGRTSRRSVRAPRARAAAARRGSPRRCAETRSRATDRTGSETGGTDAWRARNRRAHAAPARAGSRAAARRRAAASASPRARGGRRAAARGGRGAPRRGRRSRAAHRRWARNSSSSGLLTRSRLSSCRYSATFSRAVRAKLRAQESAALRREREAPRRQVADEPRQLLFPVGARELEELAIAGGNLRIAADMRALGAARCRCCPRAARTGRAARAADLR